MADITVGELASAVGLTVPAFFSDAFDQFIQGEGGYLANGMPKGLVARVGQEVGRAACRKFGANPVGSTVVNSERFERACRPYLDALSPGNGVDLNNPFFGGQCAGVRYIVDGTFVDRSNASTCGQTRAWRVQAPRGPIQGVVVDQGIFWNLNTVGDGPQGIFAVGGGRLTVGDPSQCTASPASGGINASDVKITQITRQDGQGDGCGNPPPIVTQPTPQPDPNPPPFVFSPGDGPGFGIDVTLNPDGTISFDIGSGDVTIDPFPNDGQGGGPTDPNPLPPGDQGQPGAPQDTAGGEVGGEDPTRYLVGVLVETIQRPPRAKTRFNPTEAYYAGLYYVYIGGNEGLAQIPAALVAEDQFFYAPDGSNRFKVIANVGVTLRATAYWRDVVE